jgi:hypothetical protein
MKILAGGEVIAFTHADADSDGEPTAESVSMVAACLASSVVSLVGPMMTLVISLIRLVRPRPWQAAQRFKRLRDDPVSHDETGERTSFGAGDPFEH